MRILCLLLALQAAFAAILWFGDIGFDHRGRHGLDAGDGCMFLVLYAVVLLLGLALAAKLRRIGWVGVQLLPICCAITYSLLPYPYFDSSHYQFLVGKPKAELYRAVGTPRGRVSGLEGGPGRPDEEFVDLRGMTVFISHNGTIVRVEPNNR